MTSLSVVTYLNDKFAKENNFVTHHSITITIFLTEEDLPCRGRDVGIEGRSQVCVCDANYCDTITREDPVPGTFVAYTSSNVSLSSVNKHPNAKRHLGIIQNRTTKLLQPNQEL